jgi:hypothetical protein
MFRPIGPPAPEIAMTPRRPSIDATGARRAVDAVEPAAGIRLRR